MRIQVKDLHPNPFRRLEHYPIKREKVEALKASINSTKFWNNVVGRKDANGGYELAYGHHRLTALKELGIREIDLIVEKIDDERMLKMMANENMEEWGASALVEQETVRATVLAFAESKIRLEPIHRLTKNFKHRVAPSFHVLANKPEASDLSKAYTSKTVADFLGWKDWRIETALAALAMQEEGTKLDFSGLKRSQADAVVKETRFVQRSTNDKKLAEEVGAQLAEEFRESGLMKRGTLGKVSAEGNRPRKRTEEILRDKRVAHYQGVQKQRKVKSEKRLLESLDRQVAKFVRDIKDWDDAMNAAIAAVSKFSPEAKQFAIHKMDLANKTEAKLRGALNE